jgi:hypothetical protein
VKRFTVVFTPEAEDDLASLHDYIAEHGLDHHRDA